MHYRRQIAVVFSVEDVTKKLNEISQHGFFEHEVTIYTKHIHTLHSLKMNTDIQIHHAGGLLDRLLAIVYRMKCPDVCFRSYEFSNDELMHYSEMVAKGAYVLIAEHEYPVDQIANIEKKKAFSTVQQIK